LFSGFTELRLHKQVELTMHARDKDNTPLCHGGLTVAAIVKYKDSNAKYLPIEVIFFAVT